MSLTPYKRSGIVHVIGSWSDENKPFSFDLGRALALNGFCLMTGGNNGVAKSCSEGFVSVPKDERKGVTIGVLSGHTRGYSIPGYPNKYTEVKVYMKAPDVKVGEHRVTTRNHANEADLVIALPGDSQTRNEISQALQYEHPIAVSPFWSKTYPDLWDFESVEDCIALIKAVIRDRDKRPEIHALKVANCLKGKSAKDLRDEEMKRVIEKGKENEEYARMIAEMEQKRLLDQPHESEDTTTSSIQTSFRKAPLSAKDAGKISMLPEKPKVHKAPPSSAHLFDQPKEKEETPAPTKPKKPPTPLSASAVRRR